MGAKPGEKFCRNAMEIWTVTSLKGWADALSCLYLSLTTWKGTVWSKQSVSTLAVPDGTDRHLGKAN